MKLPYKYTYIRRIHCLNSYKKYSNIAYFLSKARQKATMQIIQTVPALLALLFF
jgi:hypothetical protein